MRKDKNNIFTPFKIHYKKKNFFFIKIYINVPYLEEALKNLKYLAWGIYSSPNIMTYTII